jgi:glycogen debranching enzyme
MNINNIFQVMLTGFLVLTSTFSCGKNQLIVGYVAISDSLSKEDQAAVNWLERHERFIPVKIHLQNNPSELDNVDIIWAHIPDSSAYENWKDDIQSVSILKSCYDNGAKLLMTGYAALLPYELGIESNKPEINIINVKDNWLFDKKGLHSRMGHPVFDGLFGGAFIWDGYEDQKLPRIGYFGDNFPEKGRTLAVEKSYITIHPKRRLMIEYQSEKGRLLSVGAYVYFSKKNRLQYKMEKFLENSLLYLYGEFDDQKATYWEKIDCKPETFQAAGQEILPSQERDLENLPQTDLILKLDHPQNNFYDVAGRRALVMGKENGGIDEIWVHPFRILRDYQAGIISGDSVMWLKKIPVQVEIRPESFTRIYKTSFGEIKEIIYPSLEKAGAVIHYQANTSGQIQLIIQFRSDLRWMWPYDEFALGGVYYGYDEKLNTLHVKDKSGQFYCIFGADVKPVQQLSGAYGKISFEENTFKGEPTELNQVYHSAIFSLNAENGYCLNYIAAGTNQGREEAADDYRALITRPREEYINLVNHYKNLLDNYLTIESPDEEFNRLWKWTLVGTDRFFVHTPPLGKALVAGFATTGSGWSGGHKNCGRPGYCWYFGRDSEWSGFAIDDYGDFKIVKSQLEFLQKYQDTSGKIIHELSTSGVVHYDAADATPLYVILAAHYLRASGDMAFIQKSWGHLKKAMDFLYSTDTDDDLLIENTNVGHGWVEGGKLWGANTTFYLAGLWAQTLKDAAYIASHLDRNELSEKYNTHAEKVQKILNGDFWNVREKFYHYGKFSDGSYNPEKTVLPAVVMYYNLLDDEKVKDVLKHYAGNGFSTDWGVRILSSKSPLFNPKGYHYGSVWPLFTGWTALAEYEYGNSIQGFSHILNNLYIKNHWALGYVEEVMNGAVYQPSGVCPHQCWSETNILHPAITGMIGWKPNALENTAELKPRFPLHWDKVQVNNLRIGKALIQMQMDRQINETCFTFYLKEGGAVKVLLNPEIPDGMIIDKILVNGQEISLDTSLKRGVLSNPIEFMLAERTNIILKHRKGIGMIPQISRPKPGDTSQGYRIIDMKLEGGSYNVEVEGKSGSTGTFAVKIFDQSIQSIEGASVEKIQENGIVAIKVLFEKSKQEFVKKNIKIKLKR